MAYPKINDANFTNKINKRFEEFHISKKKQTFNEICYPKTFELQPQQKLLAAYINPKTSYKNLLVFHKIGAGKTCTAVNIAEQWIKDREIIVAVPASLKGNFRSELRSLCAGNHYLTDIERKLLKTYHPTSNEYKEIIDKSDKRIDKKYLIYSYNKLVNLIENKKLNLKNKVLIIDEVQNIVSQTGKYYQLIYSAIQNAPKDLVVILLSATPIFDKPVEIALTLNLLRLPIEFPIGLDFDKKFIKNAGSMLKSKAKNLDYFKSLIKGYISYYSGAPSYVFPETKIKYEKCVMSKFQYRSYLSVLSKESSDLNNEHFEKMKAFHSGEILKLPNNFFIGSRSIQNIAFPNKGINEDGFKSLEKSNIDDIGLYSCKLEKILTKIKSSQGPIFIYSNFKEYGGIKVVALILEKAGYLNYLKEGEGKKRYAIWSGDSKYETKEEIKAIFNQSSNYNGSKLRIILGSPSTKEGISFMNVRQVHILEPYWNYSRILQIIGRAVRHCSHKELPEEKRNVKVYIYIATHPYEKLTIDEYIMKLALHKGKIINEFELALKEVAIDCELFKNANNVDDKNIICLK